MQTDKKKQVNKRDDRTIEILRFFHTRSLTTLVGPSVWAQNICFCTIHFALGLKLMTYIIQLFIGGGKRVRPQRMAMSDWPDACAVSDVSPGERLRRKFKFYFIFYRKKKIASPLLKCEKRLLIEWSVSFYGDKKLRPLGENRDGFYFSLFVVTITAV